MLWRFATAVLVRCLGFSFFLLAFLIFFFFSLVVYVKKWWFEFSFFVLLMFGEFYFSGFIRGCVTGQFSLK